MVSRRESRNGGLCLSLNALASSNQLCALSFPVLQRPFGHHKHTHTNVLVLISRNPPGTFSRQYRLLWRRASLVHTNPLCALIQTSTASCASHTRIWKNHAIRTLRLVCAVAFFPFLSSLGKQAAALPVLILLHHLSQDYHPLPAFSPPALSLCLSLTRLSL